jgi:hypothetical protein
MTLTEHIEHLDLVLAGNDEFRAETADWPSVRTLVEVGKLPKEALAHPLVSS